MTRIWGFFFLSFMFLNSYYVAQVHKDFKKIGNYSVFDVDKARETYVNGTRYFFVQGCLNGVEHGNPDAYEAGEYNPDSPANYCNDLYENSFREQALQDLNDFGRRRYGVKGDGCK